MGAGSRYNAGTAAFNLPDGGTFNLAAAGNLTVGSGALGFNNSGLAAVNGTVTGDFNNAATGFLGGTGRITGTLTNDGTVRPGNSPGVLTVGAYTANAGSTTVITVASATNYSRIVATKPAAGAITLNAGSTLTPTLVGGYVPPVNQIFPDVLRATGAGGTVAGTFTSVAITPTLSWQALYGANNVSLQAVGNFQPAGLRLASSQASVGNMLNDFTSVTSGDMFSVLNAVTALTTNEQVATAYNEILPLKYASLPSLTFPVTRMQFQYLRDRMARLRGAAEFGQQWGQRR